MNSQPLAGPSVLIEDTFVVADALRYLIDGYGSSVSAIVPPELVEHRGQHRNGGERLT